MRDGICLESTVFLPPGDGPFPVVLVRTAYNRGGMLGAAFTRKGMAFVAQDCRGRYGSEGEWYPFVNEANDGYDTLEWLGRQPWCNGKVGMFGNSYLAATQFYVAPTGNTRLVALSPRFMAGDLWKNAYYCHGAFSLALTYSWLCFECASRTSNAALMTEFNVDELLRELPILTLDEKGGSEPLQAWRDYVSHGRRDEFWQALNVRETADRFTTPVLLTGGWYDYYPGETFATYLALVRSAPTQELSASHRVIIGPWTHGINPSSRLGQLEFGSESQREDDSTMRWLTCMLADGNAADFQESPIRIFVMGDNRWRDEDEWPPSRAEFREYHLHSGGRANSLLGDGALSRAIAGDEPVDRFHYDPRYPVPTLGGNHSIGPYNPSLYELARPGPYDQRPNERRDDVLVYTTPPLEEDLEVIGPVELRLFAATSTPDTDFVARLTDVYPDGRSMNLTEGVIRARFRERNWSRPVLVEPGHVLEYKIELQPTANVFKAGHRVRLDVSSSNFPLWDRNLNTGHDPATDTDMQVAEQTIRHDHIHPSALILPVTAG